MTKIGPTFCALLLLAACNADTFTGEDGGHDAPSDGTAQDGSMDGSSADGGTDAKPLEDASDGGEVTDAGGDGFACPLCEAGTTCCLISSSPNYGKCYATACLACCQ